MLTGSGDWSAATPAEDEGEDDLLGRVGATS